jgi:hypothetical protein
MIASVDWYETNSETVAARYEKVRTDAVHGWLLDLLPKTQATILDVGAGSGRDGLGSPKGGMRWLPRSRRPESG